MGLIPQLTDAGKAMMIRAMTGSTLNFTAIKIGDANAPSALKSGDYWYDTANNIFYIRSRLWSNATGVRISVRAEEPTNPTIGGYWYNTTEEKLKICSGGWQDTEITVAAEPPAEANIGDFWYDTENSVLKVCGGKRPGVAPERTVRRRSRAPRYSETYGATLSVPSFRNTRRSGQTTPSTTSHTARRCLKTRRKATGGTTLPFTFTSSNGRETPAGHSLTAP